MKMAEMFCDHRDKVSSGRITAVAGTAAAIALALAPQWGGPAPEWDHMLLLIGGPGGFALWQKLRAPSEQPQHEDH